MKPISQMHTDMLDTLLSLNMQLYDLAQAGCDVRVQVQDMGKAPDNLAALSSIPHVVVRVTQLVPFNTPPNADVLPFAPVLVTKNNESKDKKP